MTTILRRIGRALAAAALLLLALPASEARQDTPAPEAAVATARTLLKGGSYDEALAVLRPLAGKHPEHTKLRFLLGLAAIEASGRPEATPAEREALLDEAIAALHGVLINRPELVRVRLELARAFFYKGEDSLSREHFERVLAGEVPAPVIANVQRFLAHIRARRRWSMYLGVSLAPDTNIGAASDDEFVYINFGGVDLPLRLDNADDAVASGIGASVWTGGEYQHPLGNRLRLRAGADLARKEYSGAEFDETNLAVHAGPRWLLGPRTEVSLLASARRRWAGTAIDHDAVGARIEARRRLTARVAAKVRASWHERDYRSVDLQDGPVIDASLGGTWTITPVLQANGAVGYGKERTELERYRNDSRWLRVGLSAALPHGFNVGGTAQFRRTGYEGNFFRGPTRDGLPREDRTRTLSLSLFKRDLTLYGFSPQVVVTREVRSTNAQALDYQRTRGELRFVRQF